MWLPASTLSVEKGFVCLLGYHFLPQSEVKIIFFSSLVFFTSHPKRQSREGKIKKVFSPILEERRRIGKKGSEEEITSKRVF
jgi:hypothetical protein